MTAIDWMVIIATAPLGFLALCVACVLAMALRDMGACK